MIDIQLAYDVVSLMQDRPRGARRRAAEKHGIVPATVTEAIARVEAAMDCRLVQGELGSMRLELTAQGRALARYGVDFLATYQVLRRFIQEAGEGPATDVQKY